MIFGIGVDLTPIARIGKTLGAPHGKSFLKRVFSEDEINYGLKNVKPAEKFAGMFAAKEAVAKALGTGFSNGVSPRHIMIERTPEGVPKVTFAPEIHETIKLLGVGNVFLSISHTHTLACAYVVIEKASV